MNKCTERVNIERSLNRERVYRHGRIFDSINLTEFALLLLESLVSNRSPMCAGILSQQWKVSLHKPQIEISPQKEISTQ